MADLGTSVRRLAEPLAAQAGVDLLDVDVRGHGPQRLVRVVIDRKGGVGVDACQQLSRRLSDALDEADPIDDRYALEVTSPGTDRPLEGQEGFERVEGREVLVHRDAGEGRVLQVRGTVVSADGDGVVLAVGDADERVPYSEIVKATQALPW